MGEKATADEIGPAEAALTPTVYAAGADPRYVWYQIRHSPLTLAGIAIIALVLVTMAFARVIAPYDPNALDLLHRLAAPSLDHPFGTDEVGRDILSRVIWGTRTSVSVGFAIVGISMSFGTVLGAFSGLAGGRIDTVIMRLMDVLLSFPSFVMAMALAAALGPDLINAMLAIAVVRIPFYVRLARGQALSLRERAYVKAAVTYGASRWHIVLRHVMPNAMAPIIIQATLDIGLAILTASALSFIGLGAQQPTAEWGAMVATGRDFLLDQWWYPTFPGLAILVTAIGFNLLGDGLRDIFDPQDEGTVMAADRDPIAQIRDLHLEFPTYHGAVQALSGVTLTVRRGEIVGLVGESGSGKSVTALALLRLLPEGSVRFTGGSVALLGRDILRLPERSLEDIRGNAASMIFQEPMTALNPTIRIGRQIVQVIRRHEDVSEKEAQRRTEALLTEMQIPDAARVMRNYPFELSGGMRQRVLIAMAFSCDPDVLIADEPTTALDVTVQAQVLNLLRERARARGASVLFITHDLAVVGQLCDRVYVMYAGRVAEEGATADVLSGPLHPYTRALLKSLPEFAAPKSHLVSIRGTVPSLVNPPAGCLFRNRCPYARERCREQPPLLRPARRRGEHRAACWFLDELPDERAPQARVHEVEAAAQPDAAALLLSLRDVSVHFPVGTNWFGRPHATVHALSGVDLDIRKSETLGVVGESGCGKSTLAQVIMALQPPTTGKVVFEGVDLAIANADTLRRMRRKFQVVFQDPQSSLDPRMAVWRLISEPVYVAGEHRKGRLRARAAELAEQVGLRREQLDRYPHEFSGGQRQRIAIARALALHPELVVLDEPTSALDVSVQAQILNLLMDLQRDLRLTYLFISHNIQVVRHISHRIAVMYLGQIVELGGAGDILDKPSHPYTRTLLAAVPRLAGSLVIDAPKAGDLPSNTVLPEGCFYRDRCTFAAAGCEKPQALRPLAGSAVQVRCHRAEAIPQG